MPVIYICKAFPVLKDKPVEPVTVVIEEEMPDFSLLMLQDAFCTDQAAKLEKTLYNVLPGATYDRLFWAMCHREASHLRVAHHEVGPKEGE